MLTAPGYFAALYGMALPVILTAYIWGRKTRHRTVKALLIWSAKGWALVLALVYGFIAMSGATCKGNALYGYGKCTVFPDALANLSLVLYVGVTGLGAIYAAAVFILSGARILWARRG